MERLLFEFRPRAPWNLNPPLVLATLRRRLALASSANSGRRVSRARPGFAGSTRYRAVDTIIRAAPALSSRCRVSVSRQAALRCRRPGERIDHYRSMPCVYAACCIHDIVCHLMYSGAVGPARPAPLARYPYWFHDHWRSPMSRSRKVRSSFSVRIFERRSAEQYLSRD